MLTKFSARLLGLVGGALLLAACGSDTSGSDVGGNDTMGANPASSSDSETQISEKLLAERSNVQADLLSKGYAAVPGGMVHGSCVHGLAEGDTVDDDGNIHRASGTVETVAPCTFPHYTSAGVKIDSTTLPAPDVDEPQAPTPRIENPTTAPVLDFPIPGWREFTQWDAPVDVGNFTQQFHVPAVPHLVLGQLLYLFPALQGVGGHGILQPVLQFGESPTGGGDYWSIASWYGGDPWNGNYYSSPHVRVNPSEVITGGMNIALNDCTSAGCRWDIRATDSTHHTLTGISVHTRTHWRQVFGGVLEIYNVRYCSQYPATYDNFYNYNIHGTNNVHYTPVWSQHYNPLNQTLFCGEKITSNSTITNLFWTLSVRP